MRATARKASKHYIQGLQLKAFQMYDLWPAGLYRTSPTTKIKEGHSGQSEGHSGQRDSHSGQRDLLFCQKRGEERRGER